jgi:monoterpene epsilon-lactone hydrolase
MRTRATVVERRREVDAVLAHLAETPWPDGIVEARIHYDSLGPPIASDIDVKPLAIGTVAAQLLRPPLADDDRALLYLHGGGYVFGSLQSHGGMVAEIARAARCGALQLDYRRAPEHPFPAAVEDARSAYLFLLEDGYRPDRIALVGDSAGGGLVLATLVALKQIGAELPGAAVCISPWVDMLASGESYETRLEIDPLVQRKVVDEVTRLYLNGQDPRTPTASPLYADLAGLPPLMIQVGEREILFSDAKMLAQKAREAGIEVQFEEWSDMFHVWHLHYRSLSDGREAIGRIGKFVLDKTGAIR